MGVFIPYSPVNRVFTPGTLVEFTSLTNPKHTFRGRVVRQIHRLYYLVDDHPSRPPRPIRGARLRYAIATWTDLPLPAA